MMNTPITADETACVIMVSAVDTLREATTMVAHARRHIASIDAILDHLYDVPSMRDFRETMECTTLSSLGEFADARCKDAERMLESVEGAISDQLPIGNPEKIPFGQLNTYHADDVLRAWEALLVSRAALNSPATPASDEDKLVEAYNRSDEALIFCQAKSPKSVALKLRRLFDVHGGGDYAGQLAFGEESPELRHRLSLDDVWNRMLWQCIEELEHMENGAPVPKPSL